MVIGVVVTEDKGLTSIGYGPVHDPDVFAPSNLGDDSLGYINAVKCNYRLKRFAFQQTPKSERSQQRCMEIAAQNEFAVGRVFQISARMKTQSTSQRVFTYCHAVQVVISDLMERNTG